MMKENKGRREDVVSMNVKEMMNGKTRVDNGVEGQG
jgi:hypothetical protein